MLFSVRIKQKLVYYDSRVWYLFVTRIFNALGFSVVMPFLSIYLYQDMNVSMSIIGSIFLFSAIARASSQYVGGELADALGRRTVLLIGSIGRVVTFLLLGLIVYLNGNFLFIGLGIMLGYIFGGLFFTAADAMIADIVPSVDRVEVYALQRIGINFGWAIGPAAGGFLTKLPFYSLFFITAVVFILPVIFVLFAISESKERKKTDGLKPRYKFNLRDMKYFLIYCVFALMVFSVMSQIISTVAVFSVQNIGITKVHLGFLFTLNGLMIVFFQFHATKIIRRVPLTQALFLGALLIGSGYWFIPFARGFWTLVISMILITLGEIFVTPSGAALVSRWAPHEERGRYFGIYGLFMAFGRSVGPFYGGILMDHLQKQALALWGIIGGISILAASGFRWISKIVPVNVNKEG